MGALDKVDSSASPLNRRQAAVLKSWRDCTGQSLRSDCSGYGTTSILSEYARKIGSSLNARKASKCSGVSLERLLARQNHMNSFVSMVALAKGVVDDDPNKVALTTLHSAKGLEFPVVFIIGLNQDILPHVHETDGPNDVSEERRLFYVGITRAEKALYLTYCSHKGLSDVPLAPSEFLAEIPDHLIDLH